MEGALLSLARKAGLDVHQMSREWPRTDTIPFDSRHRFMATLHHNHEGRGIAFIKGAPEKILALCRAEKTNNEEQSLDTGWHDSIQHIAAQGQRVLAFAYREIPAGQTALSHADLEDNLVFLGLVGMIDPPRQEAVDAVAECHRAGIRVKMITGDHADTAAAIGKQVGLQRTDKVITGVDLDKLDDAQLRAQVLDCDIYARTSPEHKLRLVTALQSHGISVAMTGDGVNDAPALKRADAGIAMGKKGSEAAKEAAQLVLADDNFATIAAAVREGRTVYDNIKKVISWTLPTSAGEAMTIIAALLLGLSLPITPVQILWVNLVTAVTLGLALAFEPTEANTMSRPPRRPDEPILSGELVWHIILVSLLFLAGVFSIHTYAANQGYSEALSQTLAMNTLVVMEIFHLFFIRNIYGTSLTWEAVRGTKIVWATVIAVTVAQFAVTYITPLQAVFGTEAVAIKDGFVVVGIGVALFAIIEMEKQLRLRLREFNT
jgi:magnesium-transporting ATPase (P-type)